MVRNILLTTFFILCSATYCFAQISSEEIISGDKTVILFKASKYTIDPSYAMNKGALNRLDSLIGRLNRQLIDTLYIVSCTSPDGSKGFNNRLAKHRSTSITNYLKRKYPTMDFSKIVISEKTYLWNELVDRIKKDSACTYQIEIEKIAEYASGSQQFTQILKKVDQGKCYKYISDNYLIFLRNATAFHKNEWPKGELNALLAPPHLEQTPTITDILPIRPIQPSSYRWKYPIALKTNLLLDAVTAVNIEIEVPISRRWSVNAGYYFPWWYLKKDKVALHILYGYIEGRYWLGKKVRRSYFYDSLNGDRNPLQGWYAGVYFGKGIYDLLWKTEGVKGDIQWSAGVSVGYVRPIGKHLALEFGTSIGYLDTDYKRFVPKGECLLWKSDESAKWLGITQAKVSLVWRIGFKHKIRR